MKAEVWGQHGVPLLARFFHSHGPDKNNQGHHDCIFYLKTFQHML